MYQILTSFLDPQEDLVVKLTAVGALKVVLDDFDFQLPFFLPYLQQSVDAFMILLSNVDEFDSKLRIINCLIVLIERMEGQVCRALI